jgi:hypothetical protein
VAGLGLCLAKHKADRATLDSSQGDKLYYGARIASILGFASEVCRIAMIKPTAESLEAYFGIVGMALKVQIKANMISEAQIISERSDEVLKMVQSLDGAKVAAYFKLRLKVITILVL